MSKSVNSCFDDTALVAALKVGVATSSWNKKGSAEHVRMYRAKLGLATLTRNKKVSAEHVGLWSEALSINGEGGSA